MSCSSSASPAAGEDQRAVDLRLLQALRGPITVAAIAGLVTGAAGRTLTTQETAEREAVDGRRPTLGLNPS